MLRLRVVGQTAWVPPPTALISWAHDSDAAALTADPKAARAADRAWLATVLDFTNGLRVHGDVEADIDVAHSSEPVDWARWGPQRVQDSDFVIAVVNQAWTRRFEGYEDPTRGAGATAEADVLLGLFQEDRSKFAEKVIPVVLPGADRRDLPMRLRGTLSWFQVADLSPAGLEPVLRRIYGRPEYVLQPRRGSAPLLPPVGTPPSDVHRGPTTDGEREPTAGSTDPHSTDTAPTAATDSDLADQLAVVDSALRTLPPGRTGDGPSWHDDGSRRALERRRAALQAELERRQGPPPITTGRGRPWRRTAVVAAIAVAAAGTGAVLTAVRGPDFADRPGTRPTAGTAETTRPASPGTGSGVRVEPQFALTLDNYCAWTLGQRPVPLIGRSPVTVRIDARCNFPANPDPAQDRPAGVYSRAAQEPSAKSAEVRSGDLVELTCYTTGQRISDAAGNASDIWIGLRAPAGLLPNVNVGGGFTEDQLTGLGLRRC